MTACKRTKRLLVVGAQFLRGLSLWNYTPQRVPLAGKFVISDTVGEMTKNMRFAAADDSMKVRATTILTVRHNGKVAIGGDGQVTLGAVIVKATARKVRRLYNDRVLAGFAGATADAFTLFERFEAKLEKHQGQLARAAVELAKDWRSDRILRRLEAMLAVADRSASLIITGTGDVLEPEHGIVAIGSGGPYAQAAARALLEHTALSATEIVKQGLAIAGELCIYTNQNHVIESLDREP